MKHIALLSLVLCTQAFGANVVGMWRLDENSGQVAKDSSGTGNTGQLGSTTIADVNDPTWVAGKFGSALHFNGADQFVTVPDSASLSINGSLTLEAWIKLDAYPQNVLSPIMVKWFDFQVGRRSYALAVHGDRLRFDVSHDSGFGGACTINTGLAFACPHSALVISARPLPLHRWLHVAGVFDAATRKLQVFIDGVGDTSVIATSAVVNDSVEPVQIGAAFYGGTRNSLAGAVDEARVWKRALTPEEVLSSAQAGLIGLWSFNNDGADRSGKGNDLTTSGGANFTAAPKYGSNALGLNGTTGFASVNDLGSLAPVNSITVEAWVKLNSFPTSVGQFGPNGFAPIAAKWDDITGAKRGYFLSVVSDGLVRFDVSHTGVFGCGPTGNLPNIQCATAVNAEVISTGKITLGAWNHIAGVFDATNKKLQVFINGVADTSVATIGTTIFQSPANFMVGAGDVGSIARQFTNGSIDELRVWDRPLSALEIAFMANAATGAQLFLPGTLDFDKSENIFESEWQVGTTTPAMVLEFLVPNTAGTKITSVDAAGPHLGGWILVNNALDALVTGKKDAGKTVEVHMDLNPKAKLNTKIQFDPGQH